MTIGFYTLATLGLEDRVRLFQRGQAQVMAALPEVKTILENVRTGGDQALLDYARRFDRADLSNLLVGKDEFDHAAAQVTPRLKAALDYCMANVRRFHQAQMDRVEKHWMMEVAAGIWAGEQVTPISSVGLYVPGGKNLFPSSLYMLAIPAVLAGVSDIIVATPPRSDGTVDPVLLYVAQQCGVDKILKAGGAQAMAALAYGTQNTPRVHKILGPCSPYGAAAKHLLAGVIDPGMPAGPSEAIILCDETADPDNTILDVLNEAEHGPDAAGLLVTHDKTLAHYVHQGLSRAIADLPEPQRGYLTENMALYSGVVLTQSLDDSIDFCNAYAPEHLLVKTKDPHGLLPRLRNAGEILLGEYTPSTLGNFGIGVNHVLPTGGMAHSFSATSIWDFLKRTSLAHVNHEGFKAMADPVCEIAAFEGFPAHIHAIKRRHLPD